MHGIWSSPFAATWERDPHRRVRQQEGSKSDRHKHSTDLEAIAVHWAVTERFHPYLQSLQHFDRFTDNWAVSQIMSKKNLHRRFARIVLDLMSYNFTIHHTAGKTNVVADALSRLLATTHMIFALRAEDNQLNHAQRNDPALASIIRRTQEERPDTSMPYRLIDDRLVHVTQAGEQERHRIVVPESRKQTVLESYHDDGHGDRTRTLSKIQRCYFWETMNRDVENYVQSCDKCEKFNANTGVQTGSLNPCMPSQTPFETIAIDHVGSINSRDANKYFITAVDMTTRFIVTHAVPDKSTEHVLHFLDEDIAFTFGMLNVVITDNDSLHVTSCNTVLH